MQQINNNLYGLDHFYFAGLPQIILFSRIPHTQVSSRPHSHSPIKSCPAPHPVALGPAVLPRECSSLVETILHSRASFTRKLYCLKWVVFTSWCRNRQLVPVNCPVGSVLEFLQGRFSTRLTPSTLRAYVVAIAAYHTPWGGQSLGRNPLVTCLLRGS